MAAVLYVAGLLMIAAALGALAGLWWGVLVLGFELVALGVLTEVGTARSPERGASVVGR